MAPPPSWPHENQAQRLQQQQLSTQPPPPPLPSAPPRPFNHQPQAERGPRGRVGATVRAQRQGRGAHSPGTGLPSKLQAARFRGVPLVGMACLHCSPFTQTPLRPLTQMDMEGPRLPGHGWGAPAGSKAAIPPAAAGAWAPAGRRISSPRRQPAAGQPSSLVGRPAGLLSGTPTDGQGQGVRDAETCQPPGLKLCGLATSQSSLHLHF